jgi:MFS transporter, DHA1 family, tetracycline resistance protein
MGRPQTTTVPLTGKKFFGINILEGLGAWDFWNLYGVTFVVGILIIIPAIIQPAFLQEVIGIPRNLSGSINSGLQNMSQIATLLFIGYMGTLSDKYGRVILAYIGFFLTGFSYLIFAYAKPIADGMGMNPIAFTYICRFMVAFGFVMTWPMFSTLAADYTIYPDRGKAMAYNGLMMGAGGIVVFSFLSKLPKHYGIMILFYICIALCIIGALWLKLTLRDRMPEVKATKRSFKVIYQIVAKSPALQISYMGVLIARADQMILGTLIMVWAVTSARAYGYTHLQATGIGGTALGIQMIVSVILTPLFGYLIDRIGRLPIIIFSFFLGAAGFFILGYVGNPFSKWVWLGVSMAGFAQGVINMTSNALAANVAPKPLLGSIMGGKNSMAPIGSLIFLQLGGLFFDKYGPASAFYMKGVVNFITVLWILAVSKKVVEEEIPYKP